MDIVLIGHLLRLVEYDDREPLARYIEQGGSLDGLGKHGREILAKLVRGRSVRKRGQKLKRPEVEKRNELVVANVAFAKGTDLPIYTDTGEDDACGLVAEQFSLSREHVIRLWQSRTPSATLDLMERWGNEAAAQGIKYPD